MESPESQRLLFRDLHGKNAGAQKEHRNDFLSASQ